MATPAMRRQTSRSRSPRQIPKAWSSSTPPQPVEILSAVWVQDSGKVLVTFSRPINVIPDPTLVSAIDDNHATLAGTSIGEVGGQPSLIMIGFGTDFPMDSVTFPPECGIAFGPEAATYPALTSQTGNV